VIDIVRELGVFQPPSARNRIGFLDVAGHAMLLCTSVLTHPDCTVKAKRSNTQRSAISNGSTLLPGVDGRSAWIRRLRDLIDDHVADMGGADRCSSAELSIIRRATTLAVECERLEASFATAGGATPEALALYGTTANSLRRLLESTGLERRQTDVTPSLESYLASKATGAPVAAPAPKQAAAPLGALAPLPPPPAPIVEG
jgi:hypothetical protein